MKMTLRSPNLFLLMESERERIPHMLREDYIPIFIVNQIREHLCKFDESTGGKSHLQLVSKLGIRKKNVEKVKTGSDPWTDDSLIEEFVEFENSFMLPDDSLEFVNKLLTFAKEAMNIFEVNFRKLWTYFSEEIEFPNLELLWLMDSGYQLLSISHYLIMLKHESRIQYFKEQFLSFCFSGNTNSNTARERWKSVLKHMLQTFLIVVHCSPKKEGAVTNVNKIVSDILTDATKMFMNSNTLDTTRQTFIEVVHKLAVPDTVKRKYFSHQLFWITSNFHADVPSKAMTLHEVIQYQEQFADPKIISVSQPINDIILMMISSPMSAFHVEQVILESTKNPANKNWDSIFRLVTHWVDKDEYEACNRLKNCIKDLLNEGFKSEDEVKVTLAFILARHCSFIAPSIFSRYERWYSHTFETKEFSPAANPNKFIFFTNLLTQWVPFEPSCFLQIQATLWPYIPSECRSVWSDYVSLAKVRVAEYNEVEGAMEFIPNPNNPVQYDVEMVIKAYENTRSMPQSIAHMWMFRKQYYCEQFLPTLLKKPIGTTLSDARLRLIEVLNKEGKIPSEMYFAYKNQHH